ncbi:unnamed protein product [marine sediment metagenome]|uniref:Uncharacterized protein n=1 Tax=marine sediment metagenome TaxID=412755 RepID=X0VH13_9ZZZZ
MDIYTLRRTVLVRMKRDATGTCVNVLTETRCNPNEFGGVCYEYSPWAMIMDMFPGWTIVGWIGVQTT